MINCVSIPISHLLNVGLYLFSTVTAILASIALNVVGITETADVSNTCLMGKTILDEYYIK